MAWKKVEASQAISLKKQIVGTVWEGVYTGRDEKPSKMDKDKTQYIWKFINEDGIPFEIWGCGSLNFNMKSVPLNAAVRIKYMGLYKTKNGQDGAGVEVDYDDGK